MNGMEEKLKRKLLEGSDRYLIMINGKTEAGSFPLADPLALGNGEVKIIHFISENTKINLRAQAGAKVRITEIFYEVGENVKIETDFEAASGACIDYFSFKNNQSGGNANYVCETRLQDHASLTAKNLIIGRGKMNYRQNIFLQGKNGNLEIKNVIINSSSETHDYSFGITHQAEQTTSQMTNFGICSRFSKLNIATDGIILKGAKGTDLKQKNKGLILDEKSQIAASPWLEIGEHDCLASHGASIGAIDDDELYYLMSRGLTKEQSEKLIVGGFMNPLLREVPEGKLRQYLLEWIDASI